METQTAQIQKKLQIELDSFKTTQKGKENLSYKVNEKNFIKTEC